MACVATGIPLAAQTFPFMRLPIELRFMIYKEFFNQSGHVLLVSEKHSDNEKIIPLFRASEEIFHEAAPILYSHSQMIFQDHNLLTRMLQTPVSIMATFLTHVRIRTKGAAPCRAYKLLAQCKMLRTLVLDFCYSHKRYAKDDNYTVLKSRGVGDLLKIRGLQTVILWPYLILYEPQDYTPSYKMIDRVTKDFQRLEDHLQVLKEPRTLPEGV